jgi:integrase
MALERLPVAPVWSEWLEGWLVALRAAGRLPSTVAARRQVIAQLSREVSCGPAEVTSEVLLEWMGLEVWDEQFGRLRPRWAASRRLAVRSALMGFFRWAHGTERIEVDPAFRLPDVRPTEALPRPAPLERYFEALDQAEGKREQLMLVLACEIGLRRAEVAQVHSRDVVQDLAGTSLIVHGKGGRTRVIPLDKDLAALLRAQPAGYFFPGRIDGHLSPCWVGRLVSELLGPGVVMHQLRHLFATMMLREGANIRHVQRTLGHASLATTERYLDVEDDELRRAVGAVRARLRDPARREPRPGRPPVSDKSPIC